MRRAILVLGLALILVGLLWIGQGTGVVRWPEVSPMIDVRIWAWYGAGLAIVGGVLAVVSRRR